MAQHRIGQIGLAEGHVDLAKIGSVGPDDSGLAPVEPGAQNQLVEGIRARNPPPDREKTLLNLGFNISKIYHRSLGVFEHHIVMRQRRCIAGASG